MESNDFIQEGFLNEAIVERRPILVGEKHLKGTLTREGMDSWVFLLYFCDSRTKCALTPKDAPLEVAAALDTKWDEKNQFLIFSRVQLKHTACLQTE